MQLVQGKEQEYQNYVDINQQGDDDPIGYGRRVVTYGEEWAELMEIELAAGYKLEDFAEITSRKADTDGITGFMYGCAVSALSQFWVYGEELRRWHNLDTQLGTEGEEANERGTTLNPALLNIGTK
jgi:hypothetical protein